MGYNQKVILTVMINWEEPIRIGELYEITNLARTQLQASLVRMKDNGWVSRKFEREKYHYFLTKEGREIAEEFAREFSKVDSDVYMCRKCRAVDLQKQKQVKLSYGIPVCELCYENIQERLETIENKIRRLLGLPTDLT